MSLSFIFSLSFLSLSIFTRLVIRSILFPLAAIACLSQASVLVG